MHKYILKKLRRFYSLIGLRKKRRYVFDYEPVPGLQSTKAERLVDYCLGDYKNKPIIPCSKDSSYLNKKLILLVESDLQGIVTSSNVGQSIHDQKKVVLALAQQHAVIPDGITAWLVRGDGAGSSTDPKHGLHISGMRPLDRRDLILLPTSNRSRYLGRNLEKQLKEFQELSVPWNKKSDSAWWGGALTGDRWKVKEPRALTRREVLCYFRDHPSPQVHLHLVEIPRKKEVPEGIKLEPKFTKQSAFSHKCLILLPGNDIASGLSWYFADNSVVLMPKPHLEHILYFEMEPWKHYVPLENDPSDILVKLQWVLEHQDEAQQIVANAHARLRWFCGPEYLWACNEVLRRIATPETNATR